ncbi:Hypothetical protein NGAL_HAMBI1146_29080 [Neorhizobium galegae bv. officinalis]|nr:Hypothetical protein NGAL_HAMBI1146_29080 [Neorhizobium galegae bv. officinalis]
MEHYPQFGVALMFEEMGQPGCEIVASVPRLTEARGIAAAAKIDVAVLDIILALQPRATIAETLRDLVVPFIFSTGYGESGLPLEFAGSPVRGKPFPSTICSRRLGALSNSVVLL